MNGSRCKTCEVSQEIIMLPYFFSQKDGNKKKSEFSMRNKTANLWNGMVTVAEAISKFIFDM